MANLKKVIQVIAGTLGIIIMVGAVLLAWPFILGLAAFAFVGWLVQRGRKILEGDPWGSTWT